MKKELTLQEATQKAINDLYNLKEWMLDDTLNAYQAVMVIEGIIYTLEHPEKHYSNGMIKY